MCVCVCVRACLRVRFRASSYMRVRACMFACVRVSVRE